MKPGILLTDVDLAQFQLTLTSENASPTFIQALQRAQEDINDITEKLEAVDRYQTRVNARIEQHKSIHEHIRGHIEKITELEHLVEYYRVLQDIQDISTELSHCIHSKDEQKVVNLFLSLSGSPESSDSVIGRLQDVDAPHMKLYARRMALHWHDVIKEKLSK